MTRLGMKAILQTVAAAAVLLILCSLMLLAANEIIRTRVKARMLGETVREHAS